jgi:hypothetical protein
VKARSAGTLGSRTKTTKPCKGGTGACVALAGLDLILSYFPRVPALRAFTLGFAVARFQRFVYVSYRLIAIIYYIPCSKFKLSIEALSKQKKGVAVFRNPFLVKPISVSD